MFLHVILTTECNLQCRYCYGESMEDMGDDFSDLDIDYSLPRKIAYDVTSLDRFCRQDPEMVVTFYGGEPLLCISAIKKIMDGVGARHFMIQTNGLLLDHLEPEYVNRFHTILASIDGDEALTDFYRGKGTFRRVIDNLKLVRRNGFKGELIARMTVMEQTNIYRQVTWLLDNDEFSFESVHWQLNAGFWATDFEKRDFRRWSEETYNPGIRKLTRFWVDQMDKKGVVLRLYPLLGIAQSALSGDKSLLRCGGGWVNYAVQTDGHIIPCPTMWGMKNFYLGHIRDTVSVELKKVSVNEPCARCEILDLCGGRCLYANITRRWSPAAYASVCNTVRNLVGTVCEQVPRMRQLIEDGRIRMEDFEYMKYNGCEIIP